MDKPNSKIVPKHRASSLQSHMGSERRNYKRYKSGYEIDLWLEVRRRWLVLGVLLAILAATVAPRAGATGGILHADYLVYIPLWYIYYRAGKRARTPQFLRTPCSNKNVTDRFFSNSSNESQNHYNVSISEQSSNCNFDNKKTHSLLKKDNTESVDTFQNMTQIQNNTFNNKLDQVTLKNGLKKGLEVPKGSKVPKGLKGQEGLKVPFWKLVMSVVLHTHVVCPTLCVLTVEAFKGAGIDVRVIKGLVGASAGGAPWLALSLSADGPRAGRALLVGWLAAPLTTPGLDYIICGHIIIPPIAGIINTLLTVLIPFTIGITNVEYYLSLLKQRARNKYKEGINRNKVDDTFVNFSEEYYDKINENAQINTNLNRIHERTYLNEQSSHINKNNIKESVDKYKVDLNLEFVIEEFENGLDTKNISNIDEVSKELGKGCDVIDTKVHVSMLLVLYAEVCDRVTEAEETLHVGDLLLCLVLVCVWVLCCVCVATVCAPLAAAILPTRTGSLSVRCGPVSALPSAISLPALALLIAVKETHSSTR